MIKKKAYDNIGHINSFKDEVNETSICSMETELIDLFNQSYFDCVEGSLQPLCL